MPWLCPECRSPLQPGALICPRGHRYAEENGVLVLLAEPFRQRLQAFTSRLRSIRMAEGKHLLDDKVYEQLPFSAAVANDLEWRLRRYDLAEILRLLQGRVHQRVLDVGAWNGWLSHQLAARGHAVTAADFFADEYDGLGARQFYSTSWQAIQMDLADLSMLSERYDVVILNRCLQFFPDSAGYVVAARQRVAAGGILILTGLQFFQDPRVKARQVAAMLQHYRDHYDFELFLRPCRGYLDFMDKERLQACGVQLRPYPQLRLANIKARLMRTLPRHCYGVWNCSREAVVAVSMPV